MASDTAPSYREEELRLPMREALREIHTDYVPVPQEGHCCKRLYENCIGSSLFFEARAGALRTSVYRRRYDTSPDATTATCRTCSAEEEDVEYLVLRCTGLSPLHADGTDLSKALGFTDFASSATTDMVDAASTSKERLRKGWLETRQ
ncbi:hypothetical protein HPB50_026544 [Hyalomma asiaticum]|uniref:Uncharacterized protein n=1 Tax=Hyalomma asiaticum TaxID=266040 RepID=A0ACB7TPS4_HYAAI|nr:hypothetical protein HPB50_026544 [Hyalomma asiaticum]